MRATTWETPKVSRATRAAMMLELSPEETAANASARWMPAAVSVSRSKPVPTTSWPWKSLPRRRNAWGSRSTTATPCPSRSRARASDDPTRPHPITTMCTPPSRLRCLVPLLWAVRTVSLGAPRRSAPDGATAPTLPPVPKFATATKRLVLGLPFRSDELQGTLLRKRIALPVFASDALSSVAYAPQEVLITLSLAGLGAYALAPWVGVAVIVVLATVVLSYRQNVHAYPSGGGDYEIATVNLGRYAGLTVASALLVDYTLTVAVSVSSAADNLGALIPLVGDHKVLFAVAAILLLTAINLRGVRESGITFAIPVYCFVGCMVAMIVLGLVRLGSGDALVAPSAGFGVLPEGGGDSTDDLSQIALVFLVLRSFTQGCAALTGVEAISNGVPAFRKPKSRNAATTLAMLGLIAVFLFSGMIALARASGVVMSERPDQLIGAPLGYRQ